MVTTLMNNSTRERFVSRVSTSTGSPMSFASITPVVPSVHAAAPTACALPTATPTPTIADAMNQWLGGIDGLGCGSNPTTYGTKRNHPGRLGGVT